MADGSIIIETRIDNSGIERDSRQTQQITQQTATRVATIFQTMGTTAQNSVTNISNSVSSLQSTLQQTGSVVGQQFTRGFNSAEQTATSSLQNISQQAQETTRSIQQTSSVVGQQFASGFNSAEQTATSSLQNISRQAQETTQSIQQMNSTVENTQSGIEGLGNAFQSAAKISAAAFGAVQASLIAVGGYAVKVGDEYQKAVNQLQTSTGASMQDMEELSESIKNIYADGFGESMEEVANALANVKKNVGGTKEEIEALTKNALGFRDVFGYEVEESTRAAKAMMDNFGISAEQAYSLMAQGAQNGLDYSGELIDNINEYSVQFAKVGLNAEDMFNIFQSGADSGAWNLDKVGDAIKEFSIRAIDGSNTTIDGFQRLGMDADEMARKFAVGGETARDAFYDVIEALGEMEDPVSQSIAGVDLFGTMWEDLGPEVVTQLADIQNGYDKTKATMEEINDVKYDDIGSALEGVKRSIQTNIFIPLSEEAMPTLNEFAKGAKESVKEVAKAFETEGLEGLAKAVGKQMSKGVTEIAKLSPTFIQAGVELVKGLVEGIRESSPQILEAAGEMIATLAEGIGDIVPILKPVTTAISLLGKNMQTTIPIAASLTAALLAMKTAKSVIGTIDNLSTSFATATTAARLFGSGMSTSLTAGQAAIGLMTRQVGAATTATTLFQSALTALGGPVGIAAAAIGVLAAGVVAYSLATDDSMKAEKEAREKREKLIESIEEEKEAVLDIKEARQKAIDEAAKEISTVESQIETLQGLIDADGKVKKGQEGRAKVLSDMINDVLPDTITWNEKEGDTYLDIADNLKEVIKQKKINAAVDAATQAREDSLERREELTKNLADATKEYEEVAKRVNDLQADKDDFLLIGESSTINGQLIQAQKDLEELEVALNDASTAFVENEKMIAEQTNILEEAAAGNTEVIEKAYGERIGITIKYNAEELELAQKQYDERKLLYESALKAMNGVETEYVKILKDAMNDAFVVLQDAKAEQEALSKETGKAQAEAQASGIAEGTPAVVQAQAEVNSKVVQEAEKVSPQMEQSGINAVSGFIRGLQNSEKKGLIGIASRSLGNAALQALNQALDEHSPSKETEKSGKYFDEGFAIGIEKNENIILDVINGLGEKSLEQLERLSSEALQEAKAKAADYKELGELYSESYLSGLEEMFDGTKELIKEGIDSEIQAYEKAMQEQTDAKVEALEAQIEALEEKKTKANEKEIEQQIEQIEKQQNLIKEDNKEQINIIKKHWEEIETIQQKAIQTAYDNIENVLEEKVNAVTSTFQQQYDEITSQKEAMESKLSSYGDLFEYDGEGKIVLNDIEQIRQGIQDYYEALDELKQKGASEDFLKEVLSYDIEDATKYIDELTSMSGTQLEQYLSDWEELQSLKMEGAKEQFESQYREVQRSFTLAVEEMNKEIPQLLLSVMEESLVGLKEDMPKEYGALYEKLLADIQKKLNGAAQEGVTANIDVRLDKEQLQKTGEEAKEIIPGKEEAKASMQAAAEGIKEEEPTIEGNVKDVAETSVDVMTSYEGDFREIGNNYIDALITGMQDKYDQAVSVAGQIADAVKRELEEVAPFSDTEKENVEGTRNILESANNKQALLQKLFANVDNTRLNSMLRSMSDAVIAHQSYIARFSPVTTNNQSYQDNRVTKEGDIHFTVNTRQVNENDINKMMERANFERRKRNIAIGRK